MAKRGDFSGVLPSQLKKMLMMGVIHGHTEVSDARAVRKAFIGAHSAETKFRLKKTGPNQMKEEDELES